MASRRGRNGAGGGLSFFIFSRLLLAHLAADFPLQTNGIYRLKAQSLIGVVLHCVVVTVMNGIALAPYLASFRAWGAIVFLFAVHVALDQSKIVITRRRKRWDNLFYFFLDQGFHIFSILLAIGLFGLSELSAPASVPSWLSFYNTDALIRGAIAVTVSAFVGKVILYYIDRSVRRREIPFLPTPRDNLFRGAAAFLALVPGHAWLLLVPLAWIYTARRARLDDRLALGFNLIFPLIVGGLFRVSGFGMT